MVKSVWMGVLVAAMVGACDGAVDGEVGDEEVASTSQSVGLPGSLFEIEADANLKLNGASPALDWGSVTEQRSTDLASGGSDDSFGGGSKEDDSCPTVGTGSIPNNKSDLKTFGIYAEAGANIGDAGFLHMFWHRVQDPSGTTLMDFEFNQTKTKCANGVNPLRTVGDLLIEYRLENGGAAAALTRRVWAGSAWGPATALSALGEAAGTINTTAILSADADGLGAVSVRTFGEATISLESIFDSDKCTTFGSAFVKSRSSDAFNSALKDFIAPIDVNITNCGKVIIRKVTEPANTTDKFSFTTNLATDPSSATSFSIGHNESKEYGNVLFGSDYTVEENTTAGYELKSIDCAKSSGVVPTIEGGKITFTIDDDTDIVDCTYTNQAKGKIIIEKVSTDGTGSFNFTSAKLGGFALQTTVAGVGVSQEFANLAPGSYAVAESVPSGWALVSATCSDGSQVSAISVDAGETVKCTFTNARVRGAIRILKTRYHAAGGFVTPQPHAGVSFTVAGGGLSGTSVTTDANGLACVDNLLLSDFAGNYSVTETVPAGYVAAQATTQTVAVVTGGSCASNFAPVAFHNLPLTNLTVSVDSQIEGGTLSTITCGTTVVNTAATGDGSLTLSNLTAGTYNCTVVIKH